MTMRPFTIALLFCVFTLSAEPEETRIEDPGFMELLNGEDRSGWIDVNTSPETWPSSDGMLICSGRPLG